MLSYPAILRLSPEEVADLIQVGLNSRVYDKAKLAVDSVRYEPDGFMDFPYVVETSPKPQ